MGNETGKGLGRDSGYRRGYLAGYVEEKRRGGSQRRGACISRGGV